MIFYYPEYDLDFFFFWGGGGGGGWGVVNRDGQAHPKPNLVKEKIKKGMNF